MNDEIGPDPLGLFELDEDGDVLYSSIRSGDGAVGWHGVTRGANLFTDVMSFQNTAAFKRQFDLFRLAELQARTFEFICEYVEGPATVKVLMARLFRAPDNRTFLVHLQRP